MKHLLIRSVLLTVCIAGESMACPLSEGEGLGDGGIQVLQNNTICATLGGDQWQEEVRSGGLLYDYKRGPSDPVDTTEQVGTWFFTCDAVNEFENCTITFVYGGGASYSFEVKDNGGTYDFCGASDNGTATPGTNVIGATLAGIGAGC